MAELSAIVAYMERELKVSQIADYPGAMNGLQLANEGRVERLFAAVDASLPVIESAAKGGPSLLIVHHGMFWQGTQPVTGAFYRKLKTAIDASLAVYSSHLPLDVHPVWGNNVLLAKAVGLTNLNLFFEKDGVFHGIRGSWNGTAEELCASLRKALNGPIHVCPAGPQYPKLVGLITGGAGSEVVKVAASGVDTFITGEGPHWSYPLAEELGITVYYGGHYATETLGVQALTQALSREFNLPWEFIDHPTGL